MDDYIKLETLFQKADNHIKDGNYDLAYQELQDIVNTDPKFGKAYNHLGWLFETKFKNYPKAEEYYQNALNADPEYTATYYNFAILLSTIRKYDALSKLLEDALKIKSINRSTIYNEYGIMFESLEEYDKAIKHYKESIRHCYDNKTIDKTMESIDRCKRKIDLFSADY